MRPISNGATTGTTKSAPDINSAAAVCVCFNINRFLSFNTTSMSVALFVYEAGPSGGALGEGTSVRAAPGRPSSSRRVSHTDRYGENDELGGERAIAEVILPAQPLRITAYARTSGYTALQRPPIANNVLPHM